MKIKRIILLGLILWLLLIAAYLILPGFAKVSDAYIDSVTVSEDGRYITLHMGVSGSMGYIRDVSVHQQHGGDLYLDCYAAFGGINGSWGAANSFTIPLDAETGSIALYRRENFYQVLWLRDENGQWYRVP